MMGRRISRRTALKGLGTAVALPLLDAMLPSVFASPAAKAAAEKTPLYRKLYVQVLVAVALGAISRAARTRRDRGGVSERVPARVTWRHTRELLRPVRRYYLGAALAVVVATLITLTGPALVRYAVDAGIRKHDRSPLDVAAIAFLGLALVKPLVVRAQILLAADAGEAMTSPRDRTMWRR